MIFNSGQNEDLWLVYKGKSFNVWNNDTDKHDAYVNSETVKKFLFDKRINQVRTRASAFWGMPEEWVDDINSLPCLSPRIVYRSVTRATDRRTVITALIPPNIALADAPYVFWDTSAKDMAYLLGVLSSVPLDWCARRIIPQTGFKIYMFDSLPIPESSPDSPLRKRVIEIAGRLAATDERFSDWAKEVGVPVASVNGDEEKYSLIFELDAVVAHLYGLEGEELAHIFETFHDGEPYRSPQNNLEPENRMESALEHYRKWKQKMI